MKTQDIIIKAVIYIIVFSILLKIITELYSFILNNILWISIIIGIGIIISLITFYVNKQNDAEQ